MAGDAVLLGCGDEPCNFEVKAALTTCGTQEMIVPGDGSVTYDFEGDPDCASVRVTVGNEQREIPLAVVKLDVHIDGVGTRYTSG